MFLEVRAYKIQHLNNQRIPNRIEDLIACLPVQNDLFCPEHRKMLRNIGLLHGQPINDGPCGELSITELLEDRDPGRVSKGMEELGFQTS